LRYQKPNVFCYRLAQAVSWIVAALVFRRKVLRNELRGKKGPFVVIANHETALDFVNLIGLCATPMSFVISKSIFHALPITGFMRKLGVIPKQQFQTSINDMRNMKAVINAGAPLVIYPAGLMCEDGLSTPIPAATYKFLKWLKADVYVARATGTYFVMPKWASGIRPGRTYMDVYRLFSKEELEKMDLETIRRKTDAALLFDAYREQEQKKERYAGNRDIRGLEHVLYQCPHCKAEFSMQVLDKSTLRCTQCESVWHSDEYGLLHPEEGAQNMRYVSDWSRMIYDDLREQVRAGADTLCAGAEFRVMDEETSKFVTVGKGQLCLEPGRFLLRGIGQGEQTELEVPAGNIPTLPFSPGKYLEVQHGGTIYRCVLEDGKLVMKFINMVKIFYELSQLDACAAANE